MHAERRIINRSLRWDPKAAQPPRQKAARVSECEWARYDGEVP